MLRSPAGGKSPTTSRQSSRRCARPGRVRSVSVAPSRAVVDVVLTLRARSQRLDSISLRRTGSRASPLAQPLAEDTHEANLAHSRRIGQLDDREITTSLGKRLLMILSPFGASLRPSLPAPTSLSQSLSRTQSSSTRRRTRRSPSCKSPRSRRRTGSRSTSFTPRRPSTARSRSTSRHASRRGTRLRAGSCTCSSARWTSSASRCPPVPSSSLSRSAQSTKRDSLAHRCILLPNDPVAVGQQLPPLPPGGKAPELKLWGLTLGSVSSFSSSSLRRAASDDPSPRTSRSFAA